MRGVSIIIPVIRPKFAERCIAAICENVGIMDYEIVSQEDTERIGCPKMVKQLVEKTKYDLVMFLGDDTIPQKGFMTNALVAMAKLPDGWGLVGLNENHYRPDASATHWLADKRLLPLLDGEFFHSGYKHIFCDNELTQRCKALGRYIWAEDAIIVHDNPIVKGEPLTDEYTRIYSKEYVDHDSKLFLKRNVKRTDIINELIQKHGLKRYLEIGIGNATDNFDLIQCAHKTGVDPNVDCDYKITSDEFFLLWGDTPKFDLVFVDGLHTAEQALVDIDNALHIISENGFVVVHDCNPESKYLQRPIEEFDGTGLWCGDVWKAYAQLRTTRPDLTMYVIDADYGIGVISKGFQRLFMRELVLNYEFLDANRQELLNLVQPTLASTVQETKAIVMAGTPLDKDVKIDIRTAMFLQYDLSPHSKDGWKWSTRAGYGAEHSRNEMVLECREGNYTHLFLVDADTPPPNNTIERLLAHDKDVVAGITPVLVYNEQRWNYQIEKSVPVPKAKPRTSLFRAVRAGGTTILIKRKVLETLKWPYFKTVKIGDPMDRNGDYLSDDYYFCDKVIEAGFEIWIDPTIICGHMNLVDLMNVFFKE